MYGTYTVPNVLGEFGYGVSGKVKAGTFKTEYKGFIDRAKNHAALLEKAYTSAYKALNKSLTQQLVNNETLAKQKTNVVTGINKLLNPTETKKATTNQLAQSDFIQQRRNRLSTYQTNSQVNKRPI